MRTINGIEIKAKTFAYDGCHKIYILKDNKAKREAIKLGYDVYDIRDIATCYIYACPLRFINEWGGDFDTIVPQAADEVVFTGFNIENDLTSFEYNISVEGDKLTLKVNG